jgi:hypothetical protein
MREREGEKWLLVGIARSNIHKLKLFYSFIMSIIFLVSFYLALCMYVQQKKKKKKKNMEGCLLKRALLTILLLLLFSFWFAFLIELSTETCTQHRLRTTHNNS